MTVPSDVQQQLDEYINMLTKEVKAFREAASAFEEVAKSKERQLLAISRRQFEEAKLETEFGATWLRKARDSLVKMGGLE